MATSVSLPQWGMNMEDGTLVKWLVSEGEVVTTGQPLVEVETAKINSELESPVSGIVAHLMFEDGAVVKVGTVVAVIGEVGENPPRPEPRLSKPRRTRGLSLGVSSVEDEGRSKRQVTPIARRLAKDHGIDLETLTGSGPNGRITETDIRKAITPDKKQHLKERQVIPRARQLARDNNLDLSDVEGTGPHGRVMVSDVERVLQSSDSNNMLHDLFTESVKLSGLRKVIADRMSLSVRSMAQVTLTSQIDATALMKSRESLVSEWRPHKIRPMELDIVVAAVGDALAQHPRLNCYLQDDTISLLKDVNVGVAMAVNDGLVVPVVNQVDLLTLLDIARLLRELTHRARKNLLTVEDVSDGGFTVTSLANYDVDVFTPLVNPPQVAILGMGRIFPRPVAVDGQVTVRHVMHVSVTFDHRALDGVPVAEYIRTLKSNLESEEWLTNRSKQG